MQFQVPQFIEVEDKIFGPLTFKQFVYLAGSAGLSYMLWRTLPVYVAGPLILALLGFGAALAFLTYNGQPFIAALEHGFFYLIKSKLYLWSNEEALETQKKLASSAPTTPAAAPYVPHLSESKLHELAWSLDIKERIAAGTADTVDRENASPLPDIVAPVRTAKDAIVR
ncbi:MAG: PrgI family protein [Patescibacteria group bacterium]